MTAMLLPELSGALAMLYFVAALFFLKFRSRTGDRLFTFFAIAFFILGVQRYLLIALRDWNEGMIWLYGLRLLAFVLILVAIVDKNRGGAAT